MYIQLVLLRLIPFVNFICYWIRQAGDFVVALGLLSVGGWIQKVVPLPKTNTLRENFEIHKMALIQKNQCA